MVRPNCDCKYNRKPKLVELQLFLKRAVFYEMKKSNNDLGKFSIKSSGPWGNLTTEVGEEGPFFECSTECAIYCLCRNLNWNCTQK